ncbi:RNase H family protein [Henriciella barbarensis]|uniref:RNase H family protein n=1 Tax=Henriciella barbarensis TaxID=86342 RepID=UPI0015F93664|nr:RNase H family protein [Henriciella barbarensis]
MNITKHEATVFIVSTASGPDAAWALCWRRHHREDKTNRALISEATGPRAALLALCDVLEKVEDPATLHVISDQDYIVKSIMSDLPVWVSKGFKTAKGKEVSNADLWQRIYARLSVHTVDAKHPSGDAEREELARLKAVTKKLLQAQKLASHT